MKVLLIMAIGLLVAFYLFFYISGLIIIKKTKKTLMESGWTEEKEYEFQEIMRYFLKQSNSERSRSWQFILG